MEEDKNQTVKVILASSKKILELERGVSFSPYNWNIRFKRFPLMIFPLIACENFHFFQKMRAHAQYACSACLCRIFENQQITRQHANTGYDRVRDYVYTKNKSFLNNKGLFVDSHIETDGRFSFK